MVHQYLQAFFRDVLWGELDYLLLDLPPGTGDVQLSLSQMVPAMDMVASARFRYSAALVPWSDAELERLYKTWLQVHRAAWRLTPSFADISTPPTQRPPVRC